MKTNLKKIKNILLLTALLATLGMMSLQAKYKFTMLTQTGIDNTFWQTIKKGMDDACKTYDVDCQLLFAQQNGNLQQHVQNIETSIAQGVDGIATVVVDDKLYDQSIQRAIDKGIPVITLNVDDTEGAQGNARLAFVGQDLFQAGYEVAKGLFKQLDKKKQQHILLGLARPGESWAENRIGGAKKYIEEAKKQGWKVKYKVIDSANDLTVTGQRICQYIQGSRDTTAVIGSGFWFAGAGACLRDLGIKPNQIKMGGFDLVPILIDEMKKGYVHLTVDQQPYLQGYLPIEQLYFIKKYGLSAWDVNTGKALVTPKDVADIEKYIRQGVR